MTDRHNDNIFEAAADVLLGTDLNESFDAKGTIAQKLADALGYKKQKTFAVDETEFEKVGPPFEKHTVRTLNYGDLWITIFKDDSAIGFVSKNGKGTLVLLSKI